MSKIDKETQEMIDTARELYDLYKRANPRKRRLILECLAEQIEAEPEPELKEWFGRFQKILEGNAMKMKKLREELFGTCLEFTEMFVESNTKERREIIAEMKEVLPTFKTDGARNIYTDLIAVFEENIETIQ